MAFAKRRERRPGYSCGPNRHTLKGTLWIKDIRRNARWEGVSVMPRAMMGALYEGRYQ